MGEIWNDIPGYEGYYQVSNFGNVKSLERLVEYKYIHNLSKKMTTGHFPVKEKLLGKHLNKDGYYEVIFRKKGKRKFRIHRLVAICFIKNKDDKPCVNHIDGKKLNNNVNNLEWVTVAENAKHAGEKHLMSHGSKHKGSKYTEKLVIEVREKYSIGFRPCDLSKEYKIPISTLEKILARQSWKHI